MSTVTAAVAREGVAGFSIEQLELEPPRPDEVLVRFVASGLCHTDLEAAAGNMPSPLPIVLGHEGAGFVEAVGASVRGVQPGDRVVLSLDMCGGCRNCLTGQPAYCERHIELNFGSQRVDGTTSLRDFAGDPVHDRFIGQSSFASHAVVPAATLIKAPDDVPLTTLAPFGCGIVTGAGAVLNSLRVTAGSTVGIFGAGAVGLSALMAAAVAGAARIIALDLSAGRLALAAELGATETVDASAVDGTSAVLELTSGRGVDYCIESTGVIAVMNSAVKVLAPLGSAAILGVTALDATFEVGVFELLKGRTVTGSVMGHQAPAVLIPRLIELYRHGRFPVDRLIRTYPLAEINSAVADVQAGDTVKAVLTHTDPPPTHHGARP